MTSNGDRSIVVALGGNALIRPEERGTITEQFANTRRSLIGVVDCIRDGWKTLLTHGNGPQVGDMLLRVEAAMDTVPELPLGVCVADTEGAMGYMIQQSLINMLSRAGIPKPVVTIVTQVIVDPNDPAFANPSKPIGPSFAEEEAKKFADERGWDIRKMEGGIYRRIVASPNPVEIVEKETIRHLLGHGEVIIAAGGGGIPVVVERDGTLEGVDVVVDKDSASSMLATDVKATCLMMLTPVEQVYLNYGQPNEQPIDAMGVDLARRYLKEGHFPPGSMGPKIEGAISFIENGGKEAYITSVDNLRAALAGRAGTRVTA